MRTRWSPVLLLACSLACEQTTEPVPQFSAVVDGTAVTIYEHGRPVMLATVHEQGIVITAHGRTFRVRYDSAEARLARAGLAPPRYNGKIAVTERAALPASFSAVECLPDGSECWDADERWDGASDNFGGEIWEGDGCCRFQQVAMGMTLWAQALAARSLAFACSPPSPPHACTGALLTYLTASVSAVIAMAAWDDCENRLTDEQRASNCRIALNDRRSPCFG